MNILFLTPHPFFQNRGSPIAERTLLEVLIDQGHNATMLTYPEGDDLQLPNCEIIRLPYIPGIRNVRPGPSWKKSCYDVLLFFKARKLLRSRKFDVIHACEESVYIARHLRKVFGIPYVYDMDSSLAHQIMEKYWLARPLGPLLNHCERAAIIDSIGVLPVCKFIEDIVRSCAPDKLVQRLEDISLLPDQLPPVNDSHLIPGAGPRILYIGNLEKYQGIDLLLESFAIASPKHPKASLVIIGGDSSDVATYRAKAVDLGIGESTLFMGPKPVENLPAYLQQADILVSPRTRGFNTPMKIYSYLDSGVAVLATRLPTHTQVLDEEIAMLTDPTAPAMAEGMLKLLAYEDLRKRLAAKAKERVGKEYNRQAFSRKLTDFYQAVETILSK